MEFSSVYTIFLAFSRRATFRKGTFFKFQKQHSIQKLGEIDTNMRKGFEDSNKQCTDRIEDLRVQMKNFLLCPILHEVIINCYLKEEAKHK